MEHTTMSNISSSEQKIEPIKYTENEKLRLRTLAQRWMEIATSPMMKERKRLWKCLHDRKPVRPMILFETFAVTGYLKEEELKCEHALLRNVEKSLLYGVRQFEELDDDIVLEEHFRIPWKINRSTYGVEIHEHHAKDSLGYLSNFPIQTPDDLGLLKERTFSVDRNATMLLKHMLEEIFGSIMPVRVGNFDNFFADLGFNPFTGNNFIGITMDVFKLIGNENMMFWPFDDPDALHALLRYLTDDRIRFYNWIEKEGLLDANTDNQFAGPSSYGYVSDLPGPGSQESYKLSDVWGWPESQETQQISPDMYEEFYLPYLAEVGNLFGHTYYGCCETVDDRIDRIAKAMPNLRTVSVSGWNNFEKVGEILGNNYVYSRKPTPAHISGSYPNWDLAEEDIRSTLNAAKNGSLEFIVRDVYEVNGDISRLSKWVEMTKRVLQI